MARKKSQSKSKKPIDLTKGRKPITEEDVELYDGPTRGKRGFKLEPDFTPAATFPVPIDPVEKRMFPGSLKNAKIKRQGGEERARRSKERFAERENRRRQALADALEDNYGFNDSVKAKVDLDDRKEMRGGGAATRGTKFSSRSN
tara:strand:- start:351 stop:785 length:435 start_codon:yes stop_codon:yes gene_type:complete